RRAARAAHRTLDPLAVGQGYPPDPRRRGSGRLAARGRPALDLRAVRAAVLVLHQRAGGARRRAVDEGSVLGARARAAATFSRAGVPPLARPAPATGREREREEQMKAPTTVEPMSQRMTVQFPYKHSTGEVTGRFLAGLKEQKRIWGRRVSGQGVVVPPNSYSEVDAKGGGEWVEVAQEGTVTAVAVV